MHELADAITVLSHFMWELACLLQRADSLKTSDFTKNLQQQKPSKILGVHNPWIQQPSDSTILDSTTLGLKDLELNNSWIHYALMQGPLDSTTIGFNNSEIQQSQ